MAAEVSAELGLINDEDVLRKMWQQTEDFGKKKEIRARMYKLREQRLKEFYTTDVASDIALTGRKHAATHHVDSIADQGFMSMKTKEIRDSESPTRDIHKRQSQNNYWNTVQESYSTADDGGRLIDTYEKSMSGQGVSPDGRTYSQSSANQKHQHSSNLEETENSKKIEDQQSRSSQAVVDAHTKTDNGDVYTKASKQEEQKKSSSYTTSKTGNTTYHSSSKQESSSSSSYTKQSTSTSTSNTYQILPSGERVLVSSTTVSNPRAISDETNFNSDSQNVSKYQDTTDFISTSKRDNQTSSTTASDVKRSENISNRYSENTRFISNETADVTSRNNEVKNTNQTYTTESTDRNVCDRRQTTQNSKTENESSNVVDQKIMSELHKLDSYLSTQNATGASTPVSPNSVTGDAANWTVVSSSDGEFVYKSDKEKASPGDKPVLIKHPTSLELPKEATEGQYVTTYQQSYQPKKISVEHSPTHDAFARSLRTSPPPSNTRSSSKGSLDRSSPDRKFQKGGSPTRRSPDKERRVSVAGSYTIEKPKEVKRKVSETTYDIQKDTTVKAKRKFSTTQAKSISKVRSSTPGTSPSTSPTRMNRDRSSSSDSESDSSQLTYNKKTSTIKRTSSRKSPVNKDQSSPERSPTRKASSPTKSITQGRSTPESRPRSSSPTKSVPEKASSPSRKSPSPSNAKPSRTSPERVPVRSPSPTKTTGILRKDSKSDSASTILIKSEIVSKNDQITDETHETTTNTLKKKTEDDSQVSEFISKLKQGEETQKKAINSSQSKLTDTVDESNADKDVNKMTYHTSDEITITKTSNTDEDEGVTEIKTNKIDSSITNRDSVKEDSVSKNTSVSREDVVLSQGVVNNEVSKTETQDFIKNEKRGTTSPSCQPSFRDKSPEYSSEGSVTKEIKAARGIGKKNVSTPDSSPERSAFTPIKEFRTEPELKDKINVKVQPSKYPAGAPSPVSPRPSDKKAPDQTTKSRESSPTKSDSPSRSVSPVKQIKNKSPVRESKSSSVSPYSSPERSPTKKTKPADTHKPSSQPLKDTDKTKSVNQRTNRRSSIPRAENVTSVTRKVSEKKIELSSNKKPTTRVPSFEKRVPIQKTQNVRSDSQSSITRRTVTTRSDSQSSITKKTVTKTLRSSSARDMNTQKSTTNTPTTKVKTTAIINLQRPSNPSNKSLPVQRVVNNVVNVTVTTKRKVNEAGPRKSQPIQSKPQTPKQATTRVVKKEVVQKTSQKTVHKDAYDGSSDRSTSVSSPETVKPVDVSATKKQSTVALSLICSSDVTSKQVKSHDFKSEIDVEDLEDELPPAEFLVDDYEDDEDRPVQQVKPSVTPKSAPKTQPKPGSVDRTTPKASPAKPSTTQNKSTLNKRVSNESLTTRNQSNKNVTAKTTVVKKDTVKSKANITLNNRNNVVTNKVTPTPKSTPTKQRPTVPHKKKLVQDEPETSSSEDEETNIKENVSIITEDQQHYIDELEEIRQKEEQEYAAKLMATTNQEDSLLSVIVQLPKSSRESSPGHPAHSPFCAVSDDGGAHPRYADLISEPEDVEVIDKTKLYESTSKRYEQVTDLDEESETEDLNVSVADRVSKFLATSQAVSAPKEAPEKPAESPKTERKEVLKAKHMFETIAKNQTAPPAPNNKPVDILSRPSVFEGRQGVTTPKDKFDTFPKTKATRSSESLNKTVSTNDLSVENHETHVNVDIEENTSQQFIKNETTNVLKEIQIENIDSNTKTNKIITEEKKETTTRDKTRKTSSPEKEIQPRKSSIKDTPKKQAPAKYPGTENKETKTSVIRESKISSKKDFFERKANAEKNTTLIKERPLRKEPARPKKPSDTQVKSTDFIQNERKTSPSPRASPERKPVTKRAESPEVKRAQTKTVRENSSTEITTRKQSTERRSEIDRKSTASPTKDRRDSPRASPDKQMSAKSPDRSTPREKSPEKVATSSRPSSPTKKAPSPERSLPSERQPSLKRASPEREAPSERKPSLKRMSPERETPSERKSSLKRTSPERETPSERKSYLKRTSPERKVSVETRRQSQERTVVVEQGETVELNKAGRFGVTLKRTASTTSAATPRRSSTPGTEEIEDILQLELLEQMLEKAVGYETRRRIRAQIRIVKKMIEDGELQVTSSTSTRTTTTSKTTRSTKSPVKELESKPQTKPVTDSYKKPEAKKPVEQRPATPVQRPASPTKHKVEVSSLKSTFEKSTYEPSSKSTFEQKGAETKRAPSPSKPQDQQTVTRTETVKKTTRVETSSTNVRSQPREREPCPITSSYGVGPTDDEGRPLFGLKALRRSNTAKTLTDEPASADQPSEAPQSSKGAAPTEAVDGVFDARGRPLFGLRALQVSAQGDTPAEMPEVSSTQIRGLVNKHQQNARSSENEPQPRQKPKAKFRDSFILQDGETVEEALSQGDSSAATLPQRNGGGTSLRSLIQRHEDISSNGGTSHKEMESKTTVVTSKSVVSSDGSVSVNREVIKGELSSRNGEEPTGRIVHSKYSYQTPDDSNKSQGVASTVTTTKTIGAGGRRSSGPKITELEDSDERRSSVSSSRRYSGAKVTEVEDDEERRGEVESTRGSSSECDSNLVSSVIKKFSGSKTAETDDKWQKSSSVTSKFVSTSSTSSTSRKANSTVTESKPKSFSPTPQQKSSDDDEDKKKPLVRGDSIRALQHKFQQATESAANGAPQRGYPPAGLILRTSSFKATEESPNMSSSLKQHSTNSSTETKQRPNRTSSSSVTVRRNSKGDSSVEEKSETLSSHTTSSTSTSRMTSSEKTSFLDNTSRVTGVQDILQRMRNADLVVESGDTDEDTEARALLNKFLGASVILQGMEQGMKAAAKTNGHTPSPLSASSSPTSATLVSRVEKQRIASSNTNQLSEEELENIWDEKQLRNLLEACSDYEGRRRIRARLRAVMAEQKVCADVVAVAASDASGNSMLSQECTESKHVSTKTEGSTVTHSEVRTTSSFSSHRMTKANSVTSPFAKFKQLERQNSAPSRPSENNSTPIFKFTDPKLARSASTIKDRLLYWVQAQTKEYKNIQIDNFSTSWNDGLAFCALIHHFCPEAFDYDQLTPEKRRHNFELAFRVAEEKADIAPLLDVEDMVVMRRPDWKCVFTYVQSVYRRFHASQDASR